MKRPLNHHVRLSVAVGLEFQRDDHLQSASFAIVNWIVSLSDLLAAWLASLLLWLNALPVWWSAERRAWATEWPLIIEAARLALAGRLVFLEAGC